MDFRIALSTEVVLVSLAISLEAVSAEPEPFGTYTQSTRRQYEDRSGHRDRNDELTIRSDGTAELKSRFKVTLYNDYYLKGCREGQNQGVYSWTWKFTASVDADSVKLDPAGPPIRGTVEPSCWKTEELTEPNGRGCFNGSMVGSVINTASTSASISPCMAAQTEERFFASDAPRMLRRITDRTRQKREKPLRISAGRA